MNLLGLRETSVYGDMVLEELIHNLKTEFADHTIFHFQSNHEGDIIDLLHEIGFSCDGIVLNAAGYTHTSIAIADAVSAISVPVVEVHISDISSRESFRQQSYLKEVCVKSIMGKGTKGYSEAIEYLLNQ